MKVLILDPDSHMGALLAGGAFTCAPHFEILPARRSGEAMWRLEEGGLDTAFIDLRLARENDARLLREFSRLAPLLPLIVVADRITSAEAREVLRQGARGIVLLSMSRDALLRSVDIVASGGLFLPPGVFDAATVLMPRSAPPESPGALTPRQRDVLGLLAEGCSTREISRRLGLTEGTVKNHLSAIFRLLRVRNRVQAVLRAQSL